MNRADQIAILDKLNDLQEHVDALKLRVHALEQTAVYNPEVASAAAVADEWEGPAHDKPRRGRPPKHEAA